MYVQPDGNLPLEILAIEADATMFPAGWVMRLYTNDLTPTNLTVIGDMTQLTNVQVPGYAAVAMTWDATPARDQLGAWNDYANDAAFIATGPPPSDQIVYGWYFTDAANTVLLAAGRLDQPFTFHATGDGLRLEPRLSMVQQTGTDYLLQKDVAQT